MTAQPLNATEVDQIMSALPDRRVGTEQEYKWLIDPVEVFGTDTPGLPEALSLPIPEDVTAETPFTHTQSSIYFDDRWQLAANDLAVKLLINYGAYRNLSWICVKQTVAWVGGCRDCLEISERVDVRDVNRVMAERTTIPLAYAARLVPGASNLTPYATAVQLRHKVPLRTRYGTVFQLSLDLVTTRSLADGARATSTWIEIETSGSDLPSRKALDDWAELLGDRLPGPPYEMSKPVRAARQAGWLPAGTPA
ncbi:hypothetical protein HII36_36875 [Nonomuraea sp. NN258]|uniref:hypothetical protein n=1 Tax=Nonomuraea antri TaxID=2730852 RepID=UPI001569832F|nr:hypothetical protein [Nonomuraea antri]NRQ37371.1 hypothetical protein [Nonomuraea antri]